MVVKEIITQKEIVEKHKFCDICGDEITIGLACSVAKCIYCGKDLCEKHIGHEEDTYSDYRTVYCENCWEFGKYYRPLIDELDNKKHQLYKEWHDKCKKNI